MSVQRIKRNDEVMVIAGAHAGRHGKVVRVDRRRGRALVEGINLVRKTFKKSQQDPEGDIKSIEAPMDLSNLQPYDEESKRGVRVRRERDGDGHGIRKAVGSGRELA